MSYTFNPFIGNLDNAGDNSALTFIQQNSAITTPTSNTLSVLTNIPSSLEGFIFGGLFLRRVPPPSYIYRDFSNNFITLTGAGNTFGGNITISTGLNLGNSFINFNNIDYFDGNISISNTNTARTGLTSITFPILKGVTGSFSVAVANGLSSVDLPELQYVGGSCTIGTALGTSPGGEEITDVSFPKLEFIGGNLNIGGYGSNRQPALSSISFPALKILGGSTSGIIIGSNAALGGDNRFFTSLRTISFPLLTIGGYINLINLPLLSAVSFPNLKSLSNPTLFSIINCSAIRDVYFDNIEVIGGYSGLNSNTGSTALTGIHMPNIQFYTGSGIAQFVTVPGIREFNFGTNTLKAVNASPFVVNQSLTQQSVNNLLFAFSRLDGTNGTTLFGSGRTLELAGSNSAPSYTGGITLSAPGNVFIRTGSTVVATVTSHGFATGNIVTFSGNSQAALNGTYTVSADSIDQFRYTTTSSSSLTGGGTSTVMRRTTVSTDGFRYFQIIALRGTNVSINLP